MRRLVCLFVALPCGLTLAPAQADFSGELALLSDYRFRGVTLSDRQPSLQGSLDWSGANGLFAGAILSTVRIGRPEPERGLGAQAYLGFNGALRTGLGWSGGVTAYVLPTTSRGSADYQEVFLRLGSERWQTGLYLSPDYYGGGEPSAYVTLAASRPLTQTVRTFAHVGWLVTGRSDEGTTAAARTQRFDLRLGLAWDFGFAVAEASIVAVTQDNERCRADPDGCKATVVLALRKSF
ncbi:MAG: TorF family putative porin [Betaproteobacteria bacterium]